MKKYLVICIVILLSGCATVRTDFAPLQENVVLSKGSSGNILLTTSDLNRSYKEIGVIFVKGHHVGYKKVMETLKEKAREVGADAVIKIEVGNRFGHFQRTCCRGIAVVFK